MAKIINPLFSVAASGRIGKLLTFRNSDRASTARRWRDPAIERSALQQAASLRASWAASCYHLLTEAQHAEWLAYANRRQLPIFAAYMREFIAQNCTLIRLPLIPAA